MVRQHQVYPDSPKHDRSEITTRPVFNPMEQISAVCVTHAFEAKGVTNAFLTLPLTGRDIALSTKILVGYGLLVLQSLKYSIHSGNKFFHICRTNGLEHAQKLAPGWDRCNQAMSAMIVLVHG